MLFHDNWDVLKLYLCRVTKLWQQHEGLCTCENCVGHCLGRFECFYQHRIVLPVYYETGCPRSYLGCRIKLWIFYDCDIWHVRNTKPLQQKSPWNSTLHTPMNGVLALDQQWVASGYSLFDIGCKDRAKLLVGVIMGGGVGIWEVKRWSRMWGSGGSKPDTRIAVDNKTYLGPIYKQEE